MASTGEVDGPRDISAYTDTFRKIIQNEFKISRVSGLVANRTSTVSSTAFLQDRDLTHSILLHSPHDLIKFKTFKRTADYKRMENIDRRLIRVSTSGRLPLGVWAKWIVSLPHFSVFILGLVISNTLVLGAESELSREDYPDLFSFFDLLESFSLLVFTIEILLNWVDNFSDFWRSKWNIFDFLVTLLSAIPAFLSMFEVGNPRLATLASQLRIFRIFRSLKVVARFRNLRTIIKTILTGFSNMGFILLLLSIIAFVFAIFAIYAFDSYSTSTLPGLKYQDRFATLPEAMLTLFELFTFDNWYNLETDVRMVVSPLVTIPYFLFWIWMGAFIFRNVFVGVLVRNFTSISKAQQQQDMQSHMKQKVASKMIEVREKMITMKANAAASEPATHKTPGTDNGPDDAFFEAKELIESPFVNGLNMEEATGWVELICDTARNNYGHFIKEQAWPSDELFAYLQTMMKMQENSQEFTELQYLAAVALSNLNQSTARMSPENDV